MKRALITGVAGQDGSYLAEYLLSRGYEVHGTLRTSELYLENVHDVRGKVKFHYADLRDEPSLEKIIRRVYPDEIYNLAAQSFVPPSWTQPAETFDVNVGGLARILKICEQVCPKVRVYQASTSEMYGNYISTGIVKNGNGDVRATYTREVKINETMPMHPVSPYGVAKYAAHKLVDAYRQKGMYVVSGILFNHESPRRGEEMVTRKITRHVAQWMLGEWTELRLGNAKSKRDWGFAGDYVEAMQLMLQSEKPQDYVIGTGETNSVNAFLRSALMAAGLAHLDDFPVVFDAPEFTRQAELHCLVADYSKAKKELGWEPKTGFGKLVRMMVNSDYKKAASQRGVEAPALP